MSWQERMAGLVAKRLGIGLRQARTDDSLTRFVRQRSRALGLADEEAYVRLLEGQASRSPELKRLIAAVTIGYTFFFRNAAQLRVITRLIAERGATRRTRLWCACCSTGEEAYTLAMLLAEEGADAEILATDVDEEALQAARRAEYVDWSLRTVPPSFRETWFERRGDLYRVKRTIRERVSFRRHNVVTEPPPHSVDHAPWDLVICRNAFIYYTREAQELATQNFARALATDGVLFMGSSESPTQPMSPLDVRGQVAWRVGPREAQTWTAPSPPPEPPPLPKPPPRPRRPLEPGYPRALELLGAGDDAGAEAVLRAVTQARPDELLAWTTLGNVCLRRHAFDEALQAYGEAQRLDPILAEVHYLLGLTYRKLGDLERAAHSLRSALFLDPSFWPASFLLAGVLGRMEQPERRRAQLRITLQTAHEAGQAPILRSAAHETLVPPIQEVIQACERMLRERPGAPGADGGESRPPGSRARSRPRGR